MQRIQFIIEPAEGGFWGRVTYEDNLITEYSKTLEQLTTSIQKLLFEFHGITDIVLDPVYDLNAFFEKYNYLKISKIAELADMNPSLLRHYKAQTKYPSARQVKRIEDAIHRLASELAQVQLVGH